MSEAVREIACGSLAGAIGKIVEYPFDTVKVRLQTQDLAARTYSGPWDCLRSTVRNEGFSGLYRGLTLPMAGAAAETAILFVTYHQLSELLSPYWQNDLLSPVVCGCGAGVAASVVLTPIELIKCKMQVAGVSNARHVSVSQNIREIIAEGGIRGLWKGLLGTCIREAGGSAAWFATYEVVLELLSGSADSTLESTGTPKKITSVQRMLAGACAGVAYNFSLYPADTIKARMQTDQMMKRPALGFAGTLQSIVQAGGFRSLYNGCAITCGRAAPSSAIIFLAHGKLSEAWTARDVFK